MPEANLRVLSPRRDSPRSLLVLLLRVRRLEELRSPARCSGRSVGVRYWPEGRHLQAIRQELPTQLVQTNRQPAPGPRSTGTARAPQASNAIVGGYRLAIDPCLLSKANEFVLDAQIAA